MTISNIGNRLFQLCSILVLSVGLLSSCSTHKKKSTPQSGTIIVSPGRENAEISNDNLPAESKALIEEARKWIGTKYLYGGNTKSGVDCSGFVLQVFNNALGIQLPRTSADQGAYCSPVSRKDLVVGDLIFFVTMGGNRISHVGMYVGDDNMIHASSSKGVIVSSLSSNYYVKHLHSYGRVQPYYAMISKKSGKKANKKTENEDLIPLTLKQVRQAAGGKTADSNNAVERLIQYQLQGEKLRLDLDKVIEEKADSIISEYFD
ncbi:MAG: C40 family peptidase [Paramuribaculum sp.]|nr:C40 family peptidase [Paramuribaculum sp.]